MVEIGGGETSLTVEMCRLCEGRGVLPRHIHDRVILDLFGLIAGSHPEPFDVEEE